MKYKTVIGLEIHCELLTESKIFCSCKNKFGKKANTQTCPICSGMPGTLPNLNTEAITLAIKAGLATNCTINKISQFERKNYFYPDSPKAYQITQLNKPICQNGYIELSDKTRVRINRIQIEEDAGKLIHNENDGISLADYNRSGVPLIEIVTEPDMTSAEQVCEFVEEIASRMKYAHVCDAKMEEGSLRVDVNISLSSADTDKKGNRAEIKNINSFKSITRAIEYETQRQSKILNEGETVMLQTRRFDEKSQKTLLMRSKEEAQDYRYFAEPDILKVKISDLEIEDIKKSMPEMPHERYVRYVGLGLTPYEAKLLTKTKEFSDFYDSIICNNNQYKEVCNTMLGDVSRYLNEFSLNISEVKFLPDHVSELAQMLSEGKISKNSQKEIVKYMFLEGTSPIEIAKKYGLIMDDDIAKTEKTVIEIIANNQNLVDEYKNGNTKIFGFLMGEAIKKLGKNTNPKTIKEMLEKKITN